MLKNLVKKWRLEKNITKAHLARRIGVCRSYVSKLEDGAIQPSGEMMFRIAAYFGRRIEDIFQFVQVQKSNANLFASNTLPLGNNRAASASQPTALDSGAEVPQPKDNFPSVPGCGLDQPTKPETNKSNRK